MQKRTIKEVILKHIGENASDEQKKEAIEFAEFLESQSDLDKTLLGEKERLQYELNIHHTQIKRIRKMLIIGLITVGIGLVTLFLIFEKIIL